MKSLKNVLKTRRDVIRSQIEALEALRPRIEAAGGGLTYYAYSKVVSAMQIVSVLSSVFLLAFAFLITFEVRHIPGAVVRIVPAVVILLAMCAIVPKCIVGWSKYTYVFASKKCIDELDNLLEIKWRDVEEFEKNEADLKEYRPKFEHVMPLITGELKGTYIPHYQRSKCYIAKIGFGEYKAEKYRINNKDYIKLILRIAASLHECGTDNGRLARFIQEFEDSLS